MSEEQEWHFISVVDEQQYGPYSAEQLQHYASAGSITRETLVWTEALDDWIPASNVEGLFAEQAAAPAPHRPRLLTGADAQAARPLGATAPAPAPAPAHYPQQQPAYQHPVAGAVPQQIAPQQPAAPQQQVAPGMIPGTMPGTMQAAAPTQGALQSAALGYPAAGVNPLAPPVVPPGQPYPGVGMMKASFGLLLTMYILGILAFVGALIAVGGRMLLFVRSGSESSEEALEALGQSLFLFVGGIVVGGILLLIYRVFTIVYLYRAWNAIQPGNARCSPGKAIGFLFIPFFNLYWLFVAYIGLAKDWNRVMASHPNLAQAPRLSEGLFTTFCIMTVVTVLFYLLPTELMEGPIGTIVGLTVLGRLIIELIVYYMICRGVNFMGHLHLTTIQAQQPGMGLRLY